LCNKIPGSLTYMINVAPDGRTDGHHTLAIPAPCNSMARWKLSIAWSVIWNKTENIITDWKPANNVMISIIIL